MVSIKLAELAGQSLFTHVQADADLADRTGGASWSVDLSVPRIAYRTAEGDLEFPVQLVGSILRARGTWMWGWHNEVNGFPDTALVLANEVLRVGRERGIPELTTPVVDLSETPSLLLQLAAETIGRANHWAQLDAGSGLTVVLAVDAGELPAPDSDRLISTVMRGIDLQAVDDHRAALRAYAERIGLDCEPLEGAADGLRVRGRDGGIDAEFDEHGTMTSVRALDEAPAASRAVESDDSEAEVDASPAADPEAEAVVSEAELDDEPGFGPAREVYDPLAGDDEPVESTDAEASGADGEERRSDRVPGDEGWAGSSTQAWSEQPVVSPWAQPQQPDGGYGRPPAPFPAAAPGAQPAGPIGYEQPLNYAQHPAVPPQPSEPPMPGQQVFGQAQIGQPQAPFGQPQFGQPQAPFGQPQFGQPQHGPAQAPFGAPQHGHGQPQAAFEQPPYGQPQAPHGQSQYGGAQSWQSPPAAPQHGPQAGQVPWQQPGYGPQTTPSADPRAGGQGMPPLPQPQAPGPQASGPQASGPQGSGQVWPAGPGPVSTPPGQYGGQATGGQQAPGWPLAGQSQAPHQAPPWSPGPAQPGQHQPFPGQAFPGQQFPGQPHPGQAFPGQPFPGQQFPGQPFPGQPFSGAHPGQQLYPGQQHPAPQQYPGQQPYPGHSLQGQQPYSGQPFPAQASGQSMPGLPPADPAQSDRSEAGDDRPGQ